MKRFLLFTLSILYAILGMNPAAVHAGNNVWTGIGPDGERVQAIAVDPRNPDTVYAIAGGAIFKTTDGAANWKRVYSPATSDGTANNPALVVAIHPQDSNILYAGTATAGIFKSTNGGASWSVANAGLPKPASIPNVYVGTMSVAVLAIDPRNPETIYAVVNAPLSGLSTPKLFKSTDGGASWRAASSGLTVDLVNVDGTHFVAYLTVGSLAIDPQDPDTLYAGCANQCPPGGGVFKTTDGGADWSAAGDGLSPSNAVRILAIDPRNSDTLYAAAFSGLFKSTDGGASWSAASSGLPAVPIQSFAIDPQDPDTLYASTTTCMPCTSPSGVFKSTDGGTSWTGSGLASSVLVDPGYSIPIVLAIDPIHSNTVYAGTYNGIQKSLDGGASWNAANSGLSAGQIDSLTIDPQNAGAFFVTWQGKVSRTADGGAHWSEIYTPLLSDDGRASYPASTLVADPGAPGTYYVSIGGNSDGGGGILRSTDGGASWKRLPLPAPGGVRAFNMDPQNPSTLYASSPNRGLYKSIDGGAGWDAIASPKEAAAGAPSQCFEPVVVDPRNPGTLYVGACRDGLFKSTDGGQAWSSLVVPAIFGALAIDPQISSTLYLSDFYSGVLKTTDGGRNWKAFNSGLPVTGVSFRSIAVNPVNSNIVYAASYGLGVFWSTNGGVNWRPLNAGLTNLNVQTLLIDPRDPDTVYAGTYDGGVFAWTFSSEP